MKKLVPYGNRFLVKRRPIGTKLGSGLIVAADETKDRPTDIADVVYVPDHTFADKELLENAEEIVKTLGAKARAGDHDALKALIEFNHYVRLKSLRPGMTIMLGKYVGTDFMTSEDQRTITICNAEDIVAIVTESA